MLRLPPTNNNAFRLRAAIRSWSDKEHLPEDVQNDALLVATELFTNAVRSTQGDGDVRVNVRHRETIVVVSISNVGPAFDLASLPKTTTTSICGRGLAISGVLGRLRVSHRVNRTTVQVELDT